MTSMFTESEAAAWGGLLATYAYLDQAIDADLRARDDLTHVEFEVLLRLWRAPDRQLRVQDLANASLLTRSGMSRLVDRLVATHLVERVSDPEDGRATLVRLTEAGASRFEAAAPRHIDLVRELFLSKLSQRQLGVLAEIWTAVRVS